MRSQSLDQKLDLPLNSFKMKAVGFCKCTANINFVKFFIKCFTARESDDHQTFDWLNLIKFEVGLLAKHWIYQTLINACVVILPIEKYNLKLNQAAVVDVKFIVIIISPQENGMTVKLLD